MIRNIWAVGRNYADHAHELGNTVPTSPLFFLKSGACLTQDNSIRLPNWALDCHFELELAFQVNSLLEIQSWGLAVDLTERKLQNELKSKGQPWTLAKSFIGACPLSELKSGRNWEQIRDLVLELKINGQTRQRAHVREMIFNPLVLLDFVKIHFPLCDQDLILTGTPAGVGSLQSGDFLEASLGSSSDHWLQHQWHVSS